MSYARQLLVVCALAGIAWPLAQAAPGDVFVPAHRTRDGHDVPPNVPPLSGGTHLARRPTASSHRHASPKRAPPPVVTEAKPHGP